MNAFKLSTLWTLALLAVAVIGQTVPIEGARLTGSAEIASGGTLTVKSGATFTLESGATLSLVPNHLGTGSALQVLRRNAANTGLEFATISGGGGDMYRATYDANTDNIVDAAAAVPWAGITSRPTTLAGYGITDAQPLDSDLTSIAALSTSSFGRSLLTQADAAAARTTLGAGTSSFDGAFASLSGRPTTLAGYGITDGLATGPVTSSGLTMATARILGRSTAGSGAIEEIALGSGLTLSGGTLSASGSSSIGVPLDFGTNPGEVVVFNSSVTTQTVGTPHSYRFQIDGNDILKVYAENDGAGGLQNRRVEVNGAPLLTTASAYGAGTAYTLTTTAAAVTLGTTSPAVTLPYAGTWRITYAVQLNYSGATITNQSAAIKLRRTNNTAADLTNSSLTLVLPPATTATYTAENATKTVVYTTSLANDAVTIFANLDVAAGAGSVTAAAGGTWIVAERLY